MLNVDSSTGQRSHQLNLALVQKVVLLASEAVMGLLLDLENNVTSLDARGLVTLTTELNLGATPHTTVDVNVENLAVDNGLLSVALLAAILVLDRLALSVTVRADGLETLDHRTHLSHHRLHAVAITASAALDSTLLAATALALGADDGTLESQLRDLSAVDILEGDLVSVVNRASLGGSAVRHAAATEHASKAAAEAATGTEELSKQILSSHAATTAGTAFETSLAILVVDSALLGIGKNFVGVGNLLELLLSIGVVGVLVCGGLVSQPVRMRRVCWCLPGWYFRAFVLYAFFSSCSVAVGATCSNVNDLFQLFGGTSVFNVHRGFRRASFL